MRAEMSGACGCGGGHAAINRRCAFRLRVSNPKKCTAGGRATEAVQRGVLSMRDAAESTRAIGLCKEGLHVKDC